jgi:Peptidase S80 family
MMQAVRFSSTALAGTNKKGVLTPDEYGYYELPIGGLDCFNSAGEYYSSQRARALFEGSSDFMRRISTGCLKSENGHPKRLPGMTDEQFLRRCYQIEETLICAHFREIWLDFNSIKDRNGRPIVAVMAAVKPAGAFASDLQASLDNPHEDVCFSVRGFTDDIMVRGVNNRHLVEIITYDRVTEPGINEARKFKSPSLESMGDMFVTKETLQNAIRRVDGLAVENSELLMGSILMSMFGIDVGRKAPLTFRDW